MLGAVYDRTAVDNELTCSPTVTRHLNDDPTPAADVHVTSTCASLTTQLVAVYTVPNADTYSLLITFHATPGGPKLLPTNRTASLPTVDSDDSPAKLLTTGPMYDVVEFVPLDKLLVCPPTTTLQR
jgi:hypothetical protein